MDEKFIDIGTVPTRICTLGQPLAEPFEKKELVLCITGNPGISGFYVTFLATLFKCFKRDIPVWVIGHAGHDEPENETKPMPRLKQNKHLYDLEGQIDHKVKFIRKYVPADVKIYLIGHSIGAYIALQLLKFEDINTRIHHCYLLFPTFEYMADSPNGKLYMSTIQKYFRIIYRLVLFLAMFPTLIQTILVRIFFLVRSYPSEYVPSTLLYIKPSILSKIVCMADDEMIKVKEPDYALIEENKKRLSFLYSTTDGWTPVTYYERLVSRISDLDAQITDKYDHAFMLKSAHNLGIHLAKWIEHNNETNGH